MPTTSDAALPAEEARLARAAASGDGAAFATLYERYERRAYNLALRVTGSEDDAADAVQEAFLSVMRRLPRLEDRELAFGSYLFTATRNACYDLMQKRRRAEPSDAIPESAAPLGSGAGGLGLDPGDPEDDPDRRLLLESQQEEIRTASMRLPERQREALALRELEELSYDEIAEIMEMNRNSVAQLISRARINLRDELRGTALASIAASSPDCERALPLIALRDDRQLDEASEDGRWLAAHVAGCDTCRLSVAAMQEAGVSYRAWAPVAAAPWLLDETMAKAAELTGADWSETIADRSADRPELDSLPGIPRPYLARRDAGRRRRGLIAAALVAAALLIAGTLAALVVGDDETPPAPAAGETIAAPAEEKAKRDGQQKPKPKRTQAEQDVADAPASGLPASEPSGSGGSSTAEPKPEPSDPAPRPQPEADREPSPEPEPEPEVEEPPVVEEPAPADDPPVTPGGPNDPPKIP